MGFKLSIRDNDQDEYVNQQGGFEYERMRQMPAPYQQGPMMYPPQQGYQQASLPARVMPTPTRQFSETNTRHLSTNDPMVNLSEIAARKGFNVPPVLIAAVGGAVAWGMFQQMVIAGAVAAGAYLFSGMGKNKGGGGGAPQQ